MEKLFRDVFRNRLKAPLEVISASWQHIPDAQDRSLRVYFLQASVPECCGSSTLTRKNMNTCSIHHFPGVIAQQTAVTQDQLEKTCIQDQNAPGLHSGA